MNQLSEILGGLVIFSGIVLIVFILAKYNYLIKKEAFQQDKHDFVALNKYRYLDFGFLVVGVGVGLGVAGLFYLFDLNEVTLELLTYAFPLIFGGLGLVVAQFFRRKLDD